ncbi:hypothetical protein BDZ94DRAFT_1256712 [Collybia nuda]|uniref:Chromatin target of PRMT1 protein C-terminal domain-containing protein n=1 Tax=Collybia nuda TaxID=64659 RepID=A0A9P5Y643_9AGAR|nr:hypothetical protein BDZ94DRAFT_1256712 [Collybia nuda]
MDNFPEEVSPDPLNALSYDDTVAYEEQIPTHPTNDGQAALASRIGNTKVYLLSESTATRVGKRKHIEDDEAIEGEMEEEMDEDMTYRTNAILFHGPPISHLPTARLFAYATHFDAHPMGLEWVNDNTCVFVFESKVAARTAHSYLQKSATEDVDAEGYVTAKPIPMAIWPPEERINSSLGKGQGLRGVVRMRWALNDDVKKKGAKKESEFYKKHGRTAGKEVYSKDEPLAKRQRGDDPVDIALQKAQLDDDLDEFLAENDPDPIEPPSPPSKMRSDYISSDGRTLLERTSALRMHSDAIEDSLVPRLTAPLPRRARNGRMGQLYSSQPELSQRISVEEKLEWGVDTRPRQQRERGGRRSRKDKTVRSEQPRRKTQQELDDELDAFLNSK